MTIRAAVSAFINAPVAATFDAAVAIDPRELIRAYGPLPAIADTAGHDAPWSAVGQIRRHTMSDGSGVCEELTSFAREQSFSYRLTDFTGPFSRLASGANASWHFTPVAPARSRIDWVYEFTASGPLAERILWFVVKALWPGYLRSALARVQAKAEAENP